VRKSFTVKNLEFNLILDDVPLERERLDPMNFALSLGNNPLEFADTHSLSTFIFSIVYAFPHHDAFFMIYPFVVLFPSSCPRQSPVFSPPRNEIGLPCAIRHFRRHSAIACNVAWSRLSLDFKEGMCSLLRLLNSMMFVPLYF